MKVRKRHPVGPERQSGDGILVLSRPLVLSATSATALGQPV